MNKRHCVIGIIISIILNSTNHYQSNNGNPLRFSMDSLDIIGHAENCRRDPYQCPAGKLTQGIGHTGQNIIFQYATNRQIANWFALDLLDAQNCLEHYLEQKTGRKLSQPSFDAIGSFVFNVGCKNFVHSRMYQYLLIHHYQQACYELPKWVYITDHHRHKHLINGLVKRRMKEMKLCLIGSIG